MLSWSHYPDDNATVTPGVSLWLQPSENTTASAGKGVQGNSEDNALNKTADNSIRSEKLLRETLVYSHTWHQL